MNEEKDYRISKSLAADIFAALVLWVLLIIAKAVGAIDLHWAVVLSGILWISWALFLANALLYAIIMPILYIRHRYRLRKVDKRIIRQAKAVGVWDKKPLVLGGRALELKAWQDFRIKRRPGESDVQLRRRCMETTKPPKRASLSKQIEAERRKAAAVLYVPVARVEMSKKDTQDKGESEK